MRVDRGALVDRLVVRDEMICGVELSSGEFVDARAVVLCAGAFGSVELLQRSGIVPDVVHGVQDHPAVALVTREPIMQQSVLSIGAIGRLSVDSGVGNVHLVSMNATAPGEMSHGALLVALMDVTSRGSIIRHEDGSVSRNLDMLSMQSERHVLVQALRRVVSIVGRVEDRLATGFHLSEKSESVGWLASASNNEIEEWIMATCGVYAHAASSLPLGGEYLDRHGAVRSVDGVWVADASVMPRLIAGNPTLAIAALAKVIARSVAGATAAS
jgi:choline dehydrogenase-like flavoprotein